jgi:dTDP-4-amino-4,6-dideoxygalactose transaminase
LDTPIKIPFNKPCFAGKELAYITQAIDSGRIAGDGSFTKRCHNLLESELGVPRVLLTTSCTHALEMSALLLDIKPGDEVIVPSFTFVSTINAFVLRGAKPIFCDIRSDTLNLNEKLLPDLITDQTRAILPVHYGSVACSMDSILAVAQEKSIPVVEDNAHGLFAKYKGRFLGTFGVMATLSFHETKNIIAGEGGALIINDPKLIERAEIIREKGTNRSKFFRGEVDKYTWIDVGSSYLPSEVIAAFLWGQLEFRERIQSHRKTVWDRYLAELQGHVERRGIGLPHIPEDCEQAYHLFYLLLQSLSDRESLMSFLKQRGILSVFHYIPLHLAPMGQKFGGRRGDCPVTESVSDRLLRLPFYNDLSEQDQMYVIDSIRQWLDTKSC